MTSEVGETTDPIDRCLERWHDHINGRLSGGLDAVLHEDCVFVSPIVFTPQVGRDITKLYLTAAGGTLAGADVESGEPVDVGSSPFHYTQEIRQGNHAMLEFETTVEGKHVNGVDILTCDDDGMITEFRVMIRPLQAVNLVHAQMMEMLQRLNQT